MTITYCQDTATIDNEIGSPWGSYYVVSEGYVRLGGIQACLTSNTEAVSNAIVLDEDLSPYECIRASRLLAFWDDPKEDIYSFDDGVAV